MQPWFYARMVAWWQVTGLTAASVKFEVSCSKSLRPKGVWVMLNGVSTVRVGSICFRLYPDDHEPRHVHGEYAEMVAIVDLRGDGTVALADRGDRIRPKNALVAAWESMHP